MSHDQTDRLDEYEDDDAYQDDSADEGQWLSETESDDVDEDADDDESDYGDDDQYSEDDDLEYGDAPDDDDEPEEAVSNGSAGIAASVFGSLLATAGTAWAAVGTELPLDTLTQAGVSPFGMSTVGLIVLVYGALARGQRSVENAAATSRNTQPAPATIDPQLLESLRTRSSQDASSPELDELRQDIGRILVVLQRQDEKIANLTRATKMYGQPLVEITNQVNDVSARQRDTLKSVSVVAERLTRVEQATQAITAAVDRVAEPLDTLGELDFSGPLQSEFSRASEQLRQVVEGMGPALRSDLSELGRPTTAAVERLGARLDTVEASIDGQARRIANELGSEVSAQVQKLGSGLREEFEENSRKLREGMRSIGDEVADAMSKAGNSAQSPVDLSSVENACEHLKREVSGLATSIARLTNAPRPAAPSPTAAQPAAEPTAPSAPQQTAAPAEQGKKAPGGLAHSIAGSAAKPGKNVLGAIAKLKSMRN